jgi:hypothetical protein
MKKNKIEDIFQVVETKVNEIVRHTIVNKKGSLYRNIVQACMDQKMTDGAGRPFLKHIFSFVSIEY